MEFILLHKAEILGFLFASSELLALIPSIKANGWFQMIYQTLKKSKSE